MILALDLSTACSGWASYSSSGELMAHGRIVPDDKLHIFEKIKFIVDNLQPGMLEEKELVVEGIFLNTFAKGAHNVTGFELLARLSGAVINAWLQNHNQIPVLYKATQARKLAGVKSTCQKAEVQLWVINNFDVVKNKNEEELADFDHMIEAIYAEYAEDEISKAVFKSKMNKVSQLIEESTDIGEDTADAILLGKAYVEDQRTRTSNTDIK